MARYLSTPLIILGIFTLAGCAPAPIEVGQADPRSTSSLVQDTDTQATEIYFETARQNMINFAIKAYGIEDQAVLEVMGRVPRHEFVQQEHKSMAYANHALPIGYGQTISQPFIVALMTQELDLSPGEKVLEIGTGSGYQAAILAELGVDVFTVEIISELAQEASERLRRLDYTEIQLRNDDGYYGWSDQAPFDAIIVTAAPDHVPQTLVEQLAKGGVMVIPVGPIGGIQELWRINKDEDGAISTSSLGGVRFVPFTRTGKPTDYNRTE
jgi:protein-L-isoaspartate(D-aspartate) O-methyltransferase